MGKRPTRHDYDSPGSFGRVLEAAIACADADADDDANFAAAEMRMRQALKAHAPRVVGALGGRARAAKMTPEERRESARKAVRARWARVVR